MIFVPLMHSTAHSSAYFPFRYLMLQHKLLLAPNSEVKRHQKTFKALHVLCVCNFMVIINWFTDKTRWKNSFLAFSSFLRLATLLFQCKIKVHEIDWSLIIYLFFSALNVRLRLRVSKFIIISFNCNLLRLKQCASIYPKIESRVMNWRHIKGNFARGFSCYIFLSILQLAISVACV
jgi:hypothetical protein